MSTAASGPSSNERVQDVSFLLLFVPFALSIVYALLLWVEAGLSLTLPQSVFLQVAENPYVFLVGFVAVVLGATLEVTSGVGQDRRKRLIQESNKLQLIAVAALVVGVLAAWYAAGFDIGGAMTNLLNGRYAIIFPVLVVAVSFLMLPSVTVNRSGLLYIFTLICALGSIGIVDEVGKRNYFAGVALGAALAVVAVYLCFQGLAATKKSSAKDAQK